jgi:hypothetical protein
VEAVPAVAAPPAPGTMARNQPNPTRAPVPYANCDPIMQQRRNRELLPYEEQTYGLLRLKGVYFDSYDSI